MNSLTVNSIRHIIGLQWNLKLKDILSDSTAKEGVNQFEVPEKAIDSIQCRIKGMDGLIFSLELTSQLNVLVKGHSRWSYQLIDAFAVVKDRAFLVKKSAKLKFLDCLKLNHLDSVEEVTFHCKVLVGPPVSDSDSTEVCNDKELPSKGQFCAYLEDIGHAHCKFDGEIPEFTIDKAKELINKEGTSSVLKVLAVEYLIKSIKAENVTDILNIAIDKDHKFLRKQCSEFLRECKILMVQNDSYSLSSESEYMLQRRSGWSPISSTDFSFYNSD